MKKVSHAERASELFVSGYNCAQAVFAAFSDITGMDEKEALKLASSFGGGIGRMREVCGAFSGIAMVAGILYGYDDTNDDKKKAEHYALIQRMGKEFKDEFGTVVCRELLISLKKDSSPVPDKRTEQYYKERPCARFVRKAAEIMDRIIDEKIYK